MSEALFFFAGMLFGACSVGILIVQLSEHRPRPVYEALGLTIPEILASLDSKEMKELRAKRENLSKAVIRLNLRKRKLQNYQPRKEEIVESA